MFCISQSPLAPSSRFPNGASVLWKSSFELGHLQRQFCKMIWKLWGHTLWGSSQIRAIPRCENFGICGTIPFAEQPQNKRPQTLNPVVNLARKHTSSVSFSCSCGYFSKQIHFFNKIFALINWYFSVFKKLLEKKIKSSWLWRLYTRNNTQIALNPILRSTALL